jgi:ferrous iron transport protein B
MSLLNSSLENPLHVLLVGHPNVGKSTLFNALTGSNSTVGNYPGITVERREGTWHTPQGNILLTDVPGCYSLTARSEEEDIAVRLIQGHFGEPFKKVLCVLNAVHISKGLYLALQLMELGLDVVVVLNMMDEATAQGIHINTTTLSALLKVPVVPVSAEKKEGFAALEQALFTPSQPHNTLPYIQTYPQALKQTLQQLEPRPEHQGMALWKLLSHTPDPTYKQARTACETALGQPLHQTVVPQRYAYIDTLVAQTVHTPALKTSFSERLDRFLLHPVYGVVFFAAAMFAVFQLVFSVSQPLTALTENILAWPQQWLLNNLPNSLLKDFLLNGLLLGFYNVITFVPQIALLFTAITCLEDSGYMARSAVILDRLMQKIGLHGKSFIPLLSSFACAVPGIMATRTIESKRDRLVTMFIAPLMGCSARLPVYVMVIAALFSQQPPLWGVFSIGGLLISSMYALGFLAALGTAWFFKRHVYKKPSLPLLLELPAYRKPHITHVAQRVWERCKVFVTQTGKIIVVLSMVLWVLLSFPRQNLQTTPNIEDSYAGQCGKAIEPLIKPLGFDWKIGIGLVSSLAAREVLVSTLAQVYALDANTPSDAPSLKEALLKERDPLTHQPVFSPLKGLSLLVFFVFAMQCLSTLATLKRETNSWKWPVMQLLYMNMLAYAASFAVYQTGLLLGFT